MGIAVLATVMVSVAIMLLLSYKRRRSSELYIKRQHQIQSFPPDHLKHRR
ncbi:hypothetical protein Turpa_3590 [Turneriella parva DSM 21527]|uniref:Uncharacterized protein n=1 Tax=Turneriella parva (strain ATCC BAA-1111 / DSM 21527 / NCTC 11395 / H) TaxID=869212 RepID=I4BAB7_TURPD|nr:hypothetical protein Turpa_3590 [Turneriella parva DSM 21527]